MEYNSAMKKNKLLINLNGSHLPISPNSSLPPTHSLPDTLAACYLNMPGTCPHLRVSALSVPSAWNTFSLDSSMAHSFTSFMSLLKYHLTDDYFLGNPN